MANYTYKNLCYSIPYHYEEAFEDKYCRDFDCDSNYNGDYWVIASDYVTDLENRIEQFKSLVEMDTESAIDKLIELSNKDVWED